MKAKYHTKARRAPTIITVLLSSVCSLLTPVSWGYSFAGGTGEPNDPYQIATAGQLISIGSDANLLSKHFVLVADIDLDPNLTGNPVFDKAAIAPASSGREGTHGSPFTGVLDGNGRTISHLKIAGREYIGLFGQLASGAEVRDLGVVDIHITGSGAYVGGLAGYSEGAVTRCFSTGSVGGTGSKFGGTGSNVGGLVGRNHNGRLTQCYSTCAVSLTWRAGVGGLVGYNNSGGYVLDCYSTGAVTGGDCVGGLVGQNYGRVTQCYSIGEVLGSSTVGGLVGSNSGTTSGCFWDTQTSGLSTSAGGTGLTTAQMQDARTYLAAGWDFVDEVENGTHQIWQMPSEGGYPVLAILNGYTPPKLHGQGTPEDPYLISDAIDLGAMIYYSPYAHYRMAASINLSGIGWGMAVMPRFGGNFDGNHLTISDLTINGGSNLGLFGDLASGAEVKDLGIVDANVTGSGDDIGGLAGSSLGDVTGCYSTGAVNGAGLNVGGLVGSNGGHVIHCHSTGSVTGTGSARFNGGLGGLVGWNWGDVTQCHSTSVVFGCYDVGGLVGHNTGAVSQCFSTGEVSGFCLSAGGLVGLSSGRITNCYSTGGVSGNMFVGGLVGVNDGDVTWCYSTGLVKGIEPGGHVGEIMSKNSGDVTHCFWDIQTSGQAKSAGGIGLTTAQMHDIQTYLDAGWDFVGEVRNGAHQVWQMPQEGKYPVLAIMSELQGLGTAEDPYLISDALDLGAMVYYSPYAYYRLEASIDLAGIRWATAVVPWFAGTFDGNHQTISHMTINAGSNLGLFGELVSGAEVKNLGVVDVNITGSGDYIGGLVGEHTDGTITQCYSTGTVSGSGKYVGGVVGVNRHGILTCCYSMAAVSSDSACVGGLVGYNDGHVTQCYSTGEVSGGDYVGGLVGQNGGDVTQCSSTGVVSGGRNVGGLVGYNVGPVAQCYSSGAVNGYYVVGGLIGWNDGGHVTQCHSGGAVSGGDYVGGLVGWNDGGHVTQCYSTGAVSGGSSVGGLVGLRLGDVSGCFWDTQTSGQAKSAAGTGLTTAEMQIARTFLNAGWNFNDLWTICEGRDYPRLKWENVKCSD